MDSITHIVLGAVIGEAYTGKKLGRKAMLIGAAAQSLPDIDVIASLWLSPSENLLAHRGFIHSFLFAAMATVGFAFLFNRWYKNKDVGLNMWMLFLGTEILCHLFLDASNSYGIGWFEPFSDKRVAFNVMFVADPLFTIWSIVACIALLILRSESSKRKLWVNLALIMSVVYFLIAFNDKRVINKTVEANLANQNISYKRWFSTPAALNNILWYIVVETDSGYQLGYRSLLDHTDKIEFNYFPKGESILDPVEDYIGVNDLVKFSKGYYTVERVDSTLVFNDLRFGQMRGWDTPKSPFVFRFYLQKPEENLLVIQRGRLKGWDLDAAKSLLKRIGGE